MTTNQNTTTSKQPTHAVYHVRDVKGTKGFWTKIGAAWAHADGKGLSVQLDVAPLDGRLTLRVPAEEKAA